MIKLDPVQTLAFGGVVLMLGYFLCRKIPVLQRYSIPEPVVGGLVIALLAWAANTQGATLFQLDTSLQSALMIAFFTSVGFNASLSLLKVSGPQVALFLLICSVFAVVQNLAGIGVASMFGLNPMFGVLAGSATLTGGPATGLAFAPLFEQAGVTLDGPNQTPRYDPTTMETDVIRHKWHPVLIPFTACQCAILLSNSSWIKPRGL